MKKVKTISALVATLVVLAMVWLGGIAGADPPRRTTPEVETVTFVDYRIHAGPGPHPTACSGKFRFINGGIKWSATSVEYDFDVSGAPTGAATAVQDSFDAWSDASDAPVFSQSDGSDNDVFWASLGEFGPVAVTGVSFIRPTKEIVGFDMIFNSELAWSADGTPASGEFDVQNVGTHEAGHAFGMDHVGSPADGLETMYRFTAEGETIKRTLCTGDEEGILALY